MKRNLIFLLFVIMMTIMPCMYAQSNVEEHSKIIGQLRTNNTIRFTLEVDRDSSLCLPNTNILECYVQSVKFKKYVYVDVSNVPTIPDSISRRAFLAPGYMFGYIYEYKSKTPLGFTNVNRTFIYGRFPWVTLKVTQPKGYFYFYDKNSQSMKKIVPMETVRATTVIHMYILWIVLLIIVALGVVTFFTFNTFVQAFEEAGWLPLATLFLYVVCSLVGDAINYHRLSVLSLLYLCFALGGIVFCKTTEISEYKWTVFLKKSCYIYSYKSFIYFILSVSSILSLIFWAANQWTVYSLVLPIMVLVIVVFISISFFRKSIIDYFYHITGW